MTWNSFIYVRHAAVFATLLSHHFFSQCLQNLIRNPKRMTSKLSYYVGSNFNPPHHWENQTLQNPLNGTNTWFVFKTKQVALESKTDKRQKKKCGLLFTPPCRLQLLSTETQTNTKTRSLCVAKLPPRVNILQPFVSPLRPSQEATALSSSRTPTQWIPDAWRKWGRAPLLSLPQPPRRSTHGATISRRVWVWETQAGSWMWSNKDSWMLCDNIWITYGSL